MELTNFVETKVIRQHVLNEDVLSRFKKVERINYLIFVLVIVYPILAIPVLVYVAIHARRLFSELYDTYVIEVESQYYKASNSDLYTCVLVDKALTSILDLVCWSVVFSVALIGVMLVPYIVSEKSYVLYNLSDLKLLTLLMYSVGFLFHIVTTHGYVEKLSNRIKK